MGYRLREILFSFRKVVRKEEKKGNLKKVVVAFVLSFMLVVSYYSIPFFGYNDHILLQKIFYTIRGPIEPPQNVVIISIDDETFKKLKLTTKKPLPRIIFAEALKRIQEDKPKLTVLDLFASHNPDEQEGTLLTAEALKMSPSTMSRVGVNDQGESFTDPILTNAVKMEIPMEIYYSDRFHYARVCYLIKRRFKAENDIEEVPLLIPLKKYVEENLQKPDSFDLINYYGPPNTIRHYSLWELLSDSETIPKGYFKDKVVFIGFKSELRQRGTSDKEVFNVSVPSEKSMSDEKNMLDEMYGVEIHANIAGNLLEQKWIRVFDPEIEMCILIVFSNLLFFFLLMMTPLQGLITGIAYLTTWFVISYIAFVKFLYFVPGFYMLLIFSPFVFGGAACITATHALKELRETKKMLGLK